MQRILILILICGLKLSVAAENSEQITKWEYSIKFIKIPSTRLTFLFNQNYQIDTEQYLQIKVTSNSHGFFSRLFWVKNYYEALIDPVTHLPVRLYKKINQKNIKQEWTINYDQQKNLAKIDSTRIWKIPKNCNNFFSILFYFRKQPLKVNDIYRLNIDVECLSWQATAKVLAAEILTLDTGKINAVKLELQYQPIDSEQKRPWKTDLLTNRIAGKSQKMHLWYSADPEKVLLRVDFDSKTSMSLKSKAKLVDIK